MGNGMENCEKQLDFNMKGLKTALAKNDRINCVMLAGVLASNAKECGRPLLADALSHLRALIKSEMGKTLLTPTVQPLYEIVKKMYASGDTGENFKDRVMLGLMAQLTKGLSLADEEDSEKGSLEENEENEENESEAEGPEGLIAVGEEASL